MTTEMAVAPTMIAAIRELSEHCGEPDAVLRARLTAWEAAQALPYPSPADETWRQVDLTTVGLLDYAPASPTLPTLSVPHGASGLVVADWPTALRQHPQLLERWFMQDVVRPDENKLAALHAAMLNGAVLIYVPRNLQVQEPITVRWDFTGAQQSYAPHLLLVAEEGSRVSVLEEYASPDHAPALSVAVVEVIVGRGSHVTYGQMQRWGSAVTHFGLQRMRLARDAQVQSVLLSTGSAIARIQLEAIAHEPGSSSTMLGFRVGRRRQQCHVVSVQDHRAPQTTSDLLFKSALHEAAQASYYGTIRIHKDAQKSNAYQADRNLLLGKDSKAESTPILEIEADDVRCTHGASMGPVEEEPLFYLRSRGIPPELAETLLVYGFFEDALTRLKDSTLRQVFTQRLADSVGSPDLAQEMA